MLKIGFVVTIGDNLFRIIPTDKDEVVTLTLISPEARLVTPAVSVVKHCLPNFHPSFRHFCPIYLTVEGNAYYQFSTVHELSFSNGKKWVCSESVKTIPSNRITTFPALFDFDN